MLVAGGYSGAVVRKEKEAKRKYLAWRRGELMQSHARSAGVETRRPSRALAPRQPISRALATRGIKQKLLIGDNGRVGDIGRIGEKMYYYHGEVAMTM